MKKKKVKKLILVFVLTLMIITSNFYIYANDTKGANEILIQILNNADLSKIKALDILLTDEVTIREEKKRNFEPVNKEDYDDVYIGQDWYITIKKGKIVDEIVLPTEQEAEVKEMGALKEYLTSLNMLEEISENVVLSSNRGGKK